MNDFNFNNSNDGQGVVVDAPWKSQSNIDISALMRTVYMWMVFGLLTTAGVAAFVAAQPIEFIAGVSQWWLGIVLLQLGLVLGINFGFNKLSPTMAGGLFFLYAAVNGLLFGVIFFTYIAQGQSMAIANAFLTTSALFGAMTIVGFTTKVDLSKFGTFLMMGVIGLFIAIVVNMFLGSSMLDLVISVAGVLIFTALTAYDTQQIKEMAQSMVYYGQSQSEMAAKLSIMGALKLYLDFINLFLFLLRLFGGGRD
ncbi:MAG: Bax inhibitor-1/YccA family protein [Chloroflexota bacterium]